MLKNIILFFPVLIYYIFVVRRLKEPAILNPNGSKNEEWVRWYQLKYIKNRWTAMAAQDAIIIPLKGPGYFEDPDLWLERYTSEYLQTHDEYSICEDDFEEELEAVIKEFQANRAWAMEKPEPSMLNETQDLINIEWVEWWSALTGGDVYRSQLVAIKRLAKKGRVVLNVSLAA